MRNHHVIGLMLMIVMAVLGGCATKDPVIEETDYAELSNPWILFGTEGNPSGSEPEPFGSGWFQGGFHSTPVFSPDGKTVWWAGSYSSA